MSVLDGLLKPPRFDKDKKHDDKDGPDREKHGKDHRDHDKYDKEHKADWKGDRGHDKDDKEHKADWKGDGGHGKDGPWHEDGKFCWKDDWKDDDHGKKWHAKYDDDCGCDSNGSYGGNTEIGELHAALVQLSDVIDVVNVAIGRLDSTQSYDHLDSFDNDSMPA